MTQEEKQLLLQDLCARLPYGVILDVDTTDWRAPQGHIKVKIEGVGILFKDTSLIVNGSYYGDKYKPYLRPMSSMTKDEEKEFEKIFELELRAIEAPEGHTIVSAASSTFEIDFYNKHHFDYRGLIKKGLAIEASEENNPYKE